MDPLSPDKRSPLFIRLICGDLGYCCIYAFFRLFKRTGLIATRLGMSRRTVQLYKVRWRAGEFKCEGCKNCLLTDMRRAGK